MSDHHVVSAFIDDEPFDPSALKAALADPAARDLLIDLLALRAMAQPDSSIVTRATAARRLPNLFRMAAAAAVLGLTLVAGYAFGKQVTNDGEAPPAPTRVVKAAEWQDIATGGL